MPTVVEARRAAEFETHDEVLLDLASRGQPGRMAVDAARWEDTPARHLGALPTPVKAEVFGHLCARSAMEVIETTPGSI